MSMLTLGAFEYYANHENLLGTGAFALVYKGRFKNKPDELVAIKVMKKDTNMPKSKTLLSKEISVLKDLNHENIVRLYDHGVSSNGVYLVMEYCNGGDLAEYLVAKGTLPEDTIRHILIQIGSAMDAINRKGFMHRDLKPGNILLSHCRGCRRSVTELPGSMLSFKLADFGFARFLQDGMMAVTMCGSPMYMAPEVLMCRKYDAVADIWSMGIIVYQCLTGKAPFYANNPEALKNIYEKTAFLKPKIPVTTSRALRDLLLRMLIRNPADRIDFDNFLNHPFLHQRHFEPPTNSPGCKSPAVNPAPHQTPGVPPEVASPTTGAGGKVLGSTPFFLGPRNAVNQIPQRNQSSPNKDLMQIYNTGHSPQFHPTTQAEFSIPSSFDKLDTEMSRTTVDDYYEDELDTPALPLEPTPIHHMRIEAYCKPSVEPPRRALIQPAPPAPYRSGATGKPVTTSYQTESRVPGFRQPPFGVRPMGEVEPGEAQLEDYVIVNPDGSEAERFSRAVLPNNENYPLSNVGRIVANPTAYITGQQRTQMAGSPTVPDVFPGDSSPLYHPVGRSPVVPENVSVPTRLASRAPSLPGTNIRVVPTANTHLQGQPVLPNSGDYQVTTEAVRLRPRSGGGILDNAANIPNGLAVGGLWAANEFSDEQLMDPEHNEEIKTITMVLELCELLSELAERRSSIFSDCTVTTSSSVPVSPDSSSEVVPNPVGQDGSSPTTYKSQDCPSQDTDGLHPATASLRFVSEPKRIVEQIVLYRRILYYLEYVFVQVKKAFHNRRLKSTVTSQQRLADCNALYHRCYISLKHLARLSRRPHLIEPVGQLLANITANRLIFEYALVQCQAAEMDEYVGDVAQSIQRYKAGITLIHGLRQHAKSTSDKTLLADCMRLLHERYNSLRTAAINAHRSGPRLGTRPESGSSPASDRSCTPQPPISESEPSGLSAIRDTDVTTSVHFSSSPTH